MKSFFLALLISLFTAKIFAFLRSRSFHFSFLEKPFFQKYSFCFRSQLGGASIYFALLMVIFFRDFYINGSHYSFSITLLILTLPVFLVGLLEDLLGSISNNFKYIGLIVSSLLFIYYSNISIRKFDIPIFDILFHLPLIGLLLTCLSIVGLTCSYRLLNQYHGLAPINAIMSIFSIGYVAYICNDPHLLMSSIVVLGLLIGFCLANYPKSFPNFGSTDSYLVGFLIAILSICLVERNLTISPWFAVALNLVPIYEGVMCLWQKRQNQGKASSLSDHPRLYCMIYQNLMGRLGSNSPGHQAPDSSLKPKNLYLLFLSAIPAISSILFWNNTLALIASGFIFCCGCFFLSRKQIRFLASR